MGHVTWPNLLPLALRLRAVKELLLVGRPFDAYENDPASVDVLYEFNLVAHAHIASAGRIYRSEADASSEGPAIDAYYARISAALAQQAKPAACRSALAGDLLDALVRACQPPVCPTCSGSAGQWCRWTESSGSADAQQMATNGLCIRSITETLNWAHGVAAQAYSEAGVKARIAPSLSTAHGHRNTQLELAFDAVTNEGSHSVSGGRVVTVTFEPTTFWVSDYLSLPYVLVHECVAHAYCGVNISDEEAERSKKFHDGWMDCVAARLLERAINTASTSAGTAIDFPTEAWTQMKTIRGIRFNTKQPRPLDVSKWAEGERAFHTLWHLFALALGEECEDWTRASRESRDAVIKLSLQINGSRMAHGTRHRFVQAILHGFARTVLTQRRAALLRNIQVIDLILEYIENNDSGRLVRKISSLQP